MSRITKDLAQRVARNLVAKKEEKVKELRLEIDTFIKKCYDETLSKEILEFDKKFPGYLKKSNSIHLHGPGVEQSYYSLSNSLTLIFSENKGLHITFSNKEANTLEKMMISHKSLSQEIKNLKIEIEALLFACRTYKKAIETFPECKEYLPDDSTTVYLPSVNIDNLRKRLK